MKFFVTAEPAAPARSQLSSRMAIALAGIMTLMVVAQLFSFDEFVTVADSFSVFGLSGMTFAVLVIVVELFSLPFLLGMALSRAFRWVSMLCVAVAMGLWLSVSITTINSSAESVGFFGGVGTLTPGWWAVFVSLLWSIMAAWSIWGRWPGRSKSRL